MSVISAPACAAMPTTPDTTSHAATSVHAHHGHAATHDAPDVPQQQHTCPHCPLKTAAVGHGTCAAAESADHGGFAPAKDPTERPSLALAPSWLLPAARASPPLIANLHPPPAPPVPAVPLNVTHCVLLI